MSKKKQSRTLVSLSALQETAKIPTHLSSYLFLINEIEFLQLLYFWSNDINLPDIRLRNQRYCNNTSAWGGSWLLRSFPNLREIWDSSVTWKSSAVPLTMARRIWAGKFAKSHNLGNKFSTKASHVAGHRRRRGLWIWIRLLICAKIGMIKVEVNLEPWYWLEKKSDLTISQSLFGRSTNEILTGKVITKIKAPLLCKISIFKLISNFLSLQSLKNFKLSVKKFKNCQMIFLSDIRNELVLLPPSF